jgi:Resolvase, N terminal domain
MHDDAPRVLFAQSHGVRKSISQKNEHAQKIALFCCVSPLLTADMKYGYARVSRGGKSESVDAQARQLTTGYKKVFRDVNVSGAKTDRAQLRRLINQLDAGDVVQLRSGIGQTSGRSWKRSPRFRRACIHRRAAWDTHLRTCRRTI